MGRGDAPSVRDGATSIASSGRSSAYRAVEKPAVARTVMLEADAEAKRGLARLVDTHAECSEQHKGIAAEIETVKFSVKRSLQASSQQQTVQSIKVDAMGYRLQVKLMTPK